MLLARFCEGTSPDLQLQSGIFWEGCVGMNEANPVLSLFWLLQDSFTERKGIGMHVSLCLATCLQAKGLTDLQLQWVFPLLQSSISSVATGPLAITVRTKHALVFTFLQQQLRRVKPAWTNILVICAVWEEMVLGNLP